MGQHHLLGRVTQESPVFEHLFFFLVGREAGVHVGVQLEAPLPLNPIKFIKVIDYPSVESKGSLQILALLFEGVLPSLKFHLVSSQLLASGENILSSKVPNSDCSSFLLLDLFLLLLLKGSFIEVVAAIVEFETEDLLHRSLAPLLMVVVAIITAPIIVKENILRSLELLDVLALLHIEIFHIHMNVLVASSLDDKFLLVLELLQEALDS